MTSASPADCTILSLNGPSSVVLTALTGEEPTSRPWIVMCFLNDNDTSTHQYVIYLTLYLE